MSSFKPAAALAAAVLLSAAVIAIAPLSAQEAEAPRTLIPGKGSDLTTARCATCHDAQHITRGKLSRGQWEDNVQNMKERGAPMAPHEIPIIVEYLATYYNSQAPAPPPDPAAASFGTDGGGDPVQRLLNANACTACHTLDKKVVGPSFREVAAKYAGVANATGNLARKIRDGGSGAWGAVPMPPNPAISESDLQQVVAWILQQN